MMTISSRTPEGDCNACPVCGNQCRIEPSETPVRDAPCPHCGHLLAFAAIYEEPPTLPQRGSKSYEGVMLGVAREKFGAIPPDRIHPLLEAVGKLAASQRIRDIDDIKFFVNESSSLRDLIFRLRHLAGLPNRFGAALAILTRIRRQVGRLILSQPTENEVNKATCD